MGIRTALVTLAAATALVLSGCSTAEVPVDNEAPATYAQLDTLKIDTSDVVSIIDGLDSLKVDARPGDIMASVQPGELQLEPGGIALPLPEDEFYVSIAPYVNQTHPCTYHSLTTCLGELQNTPIELTITDTETGDIVQEGLTATADNGFVGAWLKRDREYLVRIVSAEGYAEQVIRTGFDDPSCITTMQLAPAE